MPPKSQGPFMQQKKLPGTPMTKLPSWPDPHVVAATSTISLDKQVSQDKSWSSSSEPPSGDMGVGGACPKAGHKWLLAPSPNQI